jgi:hypothetical protein
LHGISFASGNIDAEARYEPRGWQLALNGRGINLAKARLAWPQLVPLPEGWALSGRLDEFNVTARGGKTLDSMMARGTVAELSLGNPEGTVASDLVAASIESQAIRNGTRGWRLVGKVNANHGELLANRLYWNFTGQDASVSLAGLWNGARQLSLERFAIDLRRFLKAHGSADIDLSASQPLQRLAAEISTLDLGAMTAQTRDGLLSGTNFPALAGQGLIHGSVNIDQGAPTAADLTFDRVSIADHAAKRGVEGLAGKLIWHDTPTRIALLKADGDRPDYRSTLSWDRGEWYGLAIGPSQIAFNTAGRDFKLLDAARIPLFDGALEISRLQLRQIGQLQMSVHFDAKIEPISMPLICRAIGWPVFAGTLSGRIPRLILDDGVLTLGGNLEARVFDGKVVVGNLRMRDALGARPRAFADIDLDGLDLAAVTAAFSFGAITGRMSGKVTALELVDWEPTAFDAALYSTPGDKSPRRISQRAVESISSIGGGRGASAVLQRGVMRFFDQFSYDRLGISCRLRNDVCLMSGVAPHGQGYYLVKGSGLPRIDVIADARRVDWPRVVASLKELPKSQATTTAPR